MDSFDLPDLPASSQTPVLPYAPEGGFQFYFEPPRKFQHRYWVHALLFLATLGTTVLSGGWAYSLSILAILTAHEFGHYIACRIHNVDATLPFFIPLPLINLTGTLGAVIKIREPFPHKRALFDIGVAGPIAGFVALLPFLWWGVQHSQVLPVEPTASVLWLGEPVLFKIIKHAIFGTLPAGFDITIHPVGFAAWFGMLATALNLMPFGQLDGGHIAYAVLGPKARYISMGTLAVAVGLTFYSLSWISMALMMGVMAYFLGFSHPRIIDEHEPLDPRRRLIALVALVMFVICFTPIPVEL